MRRPTDANSREQTGSQSHKVVYWRNGAADIVSWRWSRTVFNSKSQVRKRFPAEQRHLYIGDVISY